MISEFLKMSPEIILLLFHNVFIHWLRWTPRWTTTGTRLWPQVHSLIVNYGYHHWWGAHLFSLFWLFPRSTNIYWVHTLAEQACLRGTQWEWTQFSSPGIEIKMGETVKVEASVKIKLNFFPTQWRVTKVVN